MTELYIVLKWIYIVNTCLLFAIFTVLVLLDAFNVKYDLNKKSIYRLITTGIISLVLALIAKQFVPEVEVEPNVIKNTIYVETPQCSTTD